MGKIFGHFILIIKHSKYIHLNAHMLQIILS